MFNKIKYIFNYLINPKYRIMKGMHIENRAIMFLGAYPIKPRDTKDELRIHGYIDESYQKLKISFKNQKYTYYKSNKYKTIWTFRELLKWRRLLPKDDSVCLEKTLLHGWSKIKDKK